MLSDARSRLTRRDFLKVAGGGVALGVGGAGLLASCGSAAPSSGSSTAGLTLPHYVRFKGPAPSLPSPSDGSQYFYNYPANPVQTVHTPPVGGGTVSANVLITGVVPAPEGQNAAWQEVERRLGCKLELDMATSADYATKLSTVIAGGNLPDFVFYAPTVTPIPNLLQFLESSCADLTPYLSGKAIEEWPNLANIPTNVWRSSAINGHLYGVPAPNSLLANGAYYYSDMLAGDEAAPKNATDFMNLLKDQTKPSAGRWGFCGVQAMRVNDIFAMAFLQEMWHVPNNWKVDSGGKFTNAIETAENKEALAFNRQLFTAGVFYPGSQGLAEPAHKTVFFGGKVFMAVDGFLNYPGFQLNSTRPGGKVRYMIPPGHNGGKGTTYLGRGFYGMSFVKKSSAKRIKELLGVANFFAAPFGTTEQLLHGYGVKGVDYTLDPDGNPVETTRGKTEVSRNPPGGTPWQYIAGSPLTVYSNTQEYVQIQHQAEVDMLAISVSDPSLGLYSQTDSTRGTAIMQTVTDGFTDIVAGRRPMSEYDSIVRTWRSSGGDQIRKEYQQAWHSSHKA